MENVNPVLITFAIASIITTGWRLVTTLMGIERKLERIAIALEKNNKHEN